MSNPRRALRMCVLWLCIAIASSASADNPMETWARWVAAQRGTWKGQTVPYPALETRPQHPWVLCSDWRALCVHGSADTDAQTLMDTLKALEHAHDLLRHGGWPVPRWDGGRGGTAQHDVYLVDQAMGDPLGHFDVPHVDGNLDGAVAFATFPSVVTPERRVPCALAVLTEAALLERDPAEAPAWRRASGAFVASLATGESGCDEAARTVQQQQAHRGWITDEPQTGAGAALLLGMLSDRLDGGTGVFVRELWQLTRQWTWEGPGLRGSPDLWEALDAALENAHEKLPQLIEDFAVARYFARPGQFAPYPSLRGLPSDAVVPVTGPITRQQMPEHVHADASLETFGSTYTLVDVRDFDPMGRLRVWLRGELGVEWSLIAVRLRSDGSEVGRIVAPPRRDPRSFFPVELLGETSRVLLVVTNMGKGLPDADIEAARAHAFTLIVDVDREDTATPTVP